MGLNSMQLVALILLTLLKVVASDTDEQHPESATLNVTHKVELQLGQPPNASDPMLRRIDLDFRSSHLTDSTVIFGLVNLETGQLVVSYSRTSSLSAIFVWRTPDGNVMNKELNLDTKISIGLGDWCRLTIPLHANASTWWILNGMPVPVEVPEGFRSSFAWNRGTTVYFGPAFRGCIANVILNEQVKVPLNLESKLLETEKDRLTLVHPEMVPASGGCYQVCDCLNNGSCYFSPWDRRFTCTCQRGYEGPVCGYEWNTCQHLESGRECLNGGVCINVPGVDNYRCNCTSQYAGSRCQNDNICATEHPCQNGASCRMKDDQPDYECACINGFTGRNCTDTLLSSLTPDSSSAPTSLAPTSWFPTSWFPTSLTPVSPSPKPTEPEKDGAVIHLNVIGVVFMGSAGLVLLIAVLVLTVWNVKLRQARRGRNNSTSSRQEVMREANYIN